MMKRSFSGRIGGGSGGVGGGMLRTFRRAVRAGGVGGGGAAVQEPFSQSTTTTPTIPSSTYKPTSSNTLSLSSSNSSFNLPISSATSNGGPSWASSSSACSDELDWEYINGSHENENEMSYGLYDDHFVFGSVPSVDEVQHAVSSLQQVLDQASFSQCIKERAAAYNYSDKEVMDQNISSSRVPSSVGSEVDWMEPSLQLRSPRMLSPCGSDRVYDAFHLLQTEPSLQKMVISLSSDEAVWRAVLNNGVVRELRETLNAADKNAAGSSSDDGSDGSKAATGIVRWMFVNTKAKILELIDKIANLVDALFQSPVSEEETDVEEQFGIKLRTIFMISVVVFLIVVVTRAHRV